MTLEPYTATDYISLHSAAELKRMLLWDCRFDL